MYGELKTVTIAVEEYRDLKRSNRLLEALEEAVFENWSMYTSEVHRIYAEAEYY